MEDKSKDENLPSGNGEPEDHSSGNKDDGGKPGGEKINDENAERESSEPEVSGLTPEEKPSDENILPEEESSEIRSAEKGPDENVDENDSAGNGTEEVQQAQPESEGEFHGGIPGGETPGHPYPRRLHKSVHDRIIFGVCGGLGEYLGINTVVIRLFFILSLLIGGWGAVIYFLATVFIPNNPEEEIPEDDSPGSPKERANTRVLAGSFFLLAGAYILFRNLGLLYYFNFFGMARDVVIPVVLIFSGLYIVVRYHSGGTLTGSFMPAKFRRSVIDRRISGVCGGFAEYLNAESSIIRILWVVFTLSSFGIGILIYILFAVFVPEKEGAAVEQNS